jgi:hypothetical protein
MGPGTEVPGHLKPVLHPPPGRSRGRAAPAAESNASDGRQPSPVHGEGPPAVSVVRQVLVVACGLLMAPAGRLMYFCAVVWPWNRLEAW